MYISVGADWQAGRDARWGLPPVTAGHVRSALLKTLLSQPAQADSPVPACQVTVTALLHMGITTPTLNAPRQLNADPSNVAHSCLQPACRRHLSHDCSTTNRSTMHSHSKQAVRETLQHTLNLPLVRNKWCVACHVPTTATATPQQEESTAEGGEETNVDAADMYWH
jgi:hypothetical protein